MPRSEADIVAGIIRVPYRDGSQREVRTLTRRAAKAWRQTVMNAGLGVFTQSADRGGLEKAASVAGETMIELIVAYDVGDVLGGADAIEDGFDDAQIWAILRQMLEVTFLPFVDDLGKVYGVLSDLGIDLKSGSKPSPSEPSSNSPSRNGRSGRTPSTTGSATSS